MVLQYVLWRKQDVFVFMALSLLSEGRVIKSYVIPLDLRGVCGSRRCQRWGWVWAEDFQRGADNSVQLLPRRSCGVAVPHRYSEGESNLCLHPPQSRLFELSQEINPWWAFLRMLIMLLSHFREEETVVPRSQSLSCFLVQLSPIYCMSWGCSLKRS